MWIEARDGGFVNLSKAIAVELEWPASGSVRVDVHFEGGLYMTLAEFGKEEDANSYMKCISNHLGIWMP